MSDKLSVNSKSNRLIDPDIASILLFSFAGLSAFSGIHRVFVHYRDEYEKEECFENDLRGFVRNIKEVNTSLLFFVRQVDKLEKLINKVTKRDLNNNLLMQPLRFGETSLYLYKAELEHFISIQDGIFESLRNYNIRLTTMAEFLSLYPNQLSNERRLMYKNQLKLLTDNFNYIYKMDLHIGNLFKVLRELSLDIHNLLSDMEETYEEQISKW